MDYETAMWSQKLHLVFFSLNPRLQQTRMTNKSIPQLSKLQNLVQKKIFFLSIYALLPDIKWLKKFWCLTRPTKWSNGWHSERARKSERIKIFVSENNLFRGPVPGHRSGWKLGLNLHLVFVIRLSDWPPQTSSLCCQKRSISEYISFTVC